jgi:hypothetical protein
MFNVKKCPGIINCQFEKLSAVETLKNATNKEKMLY